MTFWRLRLARGTGSGRRVDVLLLDADADARMETVLAAFRSGGHRAKTFRARGRDLAEFATIAEAGLTHGTLLTTGRASSDNRAADRRSGPHLVVAAGPQSGHSVRLAPNQPVVIGREASVDLPIDDHLVSGSHARVLLDDAGTVSIADLDSTNGTYVESHRLARPTTIEPGAFVQVGASVLCLVQVGEDDLPALPEPDGAEQPFPRRFLEHQAGVERHLDQPRRLAEQGQDEASWRDYLRPAGMALSGLALVLYTGRWIFLLVSMMSPLLFLVETRHRGRKRRRDRELEEAREAQELEQFSAQLTEALATERRLLRDRLPTSAVATFLASMRHADLWQRDPSKNVEFGQLTIGLATMPSSVRVADHSAHLRQWALPATLSLPEAGSVEILGPVDRVRATARGLLLQLAALHSPTDLAVWLLADAEEPWEFARWLPHGYGPRGSSRIALDDVQRKQMAATLRQTLDDRVGTASKDRPLPVHVFVVDGADLMAAPDLAKLLREGGAHGIHGIVLDTQHRAEGEGATLRLDPETGFGSLTSTTTAAVDQLLVSEIPTDTAMSAALAMAGLRPAGAASSAPTLAASLLELLELPRPSAQEVLDRWSSRSPQTSIPVGHQGSAPWQLDFDRDGPHSLVAGTNGSGKTEFVQTMIAGLCLSNSPDDLSLLIIDYKGLDYGELRGLPHLVSLITKGDIEGYTRTMLLIEAEFVRRRKLFDSLGAQNLNAYREARQTDPSLPTIPRLLVIIDEFAELLNDPVGKQHMKILESVARTARAYGIHLMLITQDFSGQLPKQIEANAGLRISFRVEEPGDSKAVLGSPVASTVPGDLPGRGWARTKGSSPFEFHATRVRNEHANGSNAEEAHVESVPLTEVARAGSSGGAGDVPFGRSDLAAIKRAVTEAAEHTGWQGSPVPWPPELPDQVALDDILARQDRPGAAFALADVPSRQARDVLLLDDHDELSMVISSDADEVARTLITIGTSLSLQRPPEHRHLYVIDVTGRGLRELGALPHVANVATRNEALALRTLNWLTVEAVRRRAAFETDGRGTWSDRDPEDRPPQLVLLVNGMHRLMSAAGRERSPAYDALLNLVSELPGSGVSAVIGSGPVGAESTIAAEVGRRLVLHCVERPMYVMAGVPRERTSDFDRPGRIYDTKTGWLGQAGTLGTTDASRGEVLQALGAHMHADFDDAKGGPVPVPDVPWPAAWERLDLESLVPPEDFQHPLPMGINTTTGQWHWIDAAEEGPVLVIGGSGASGRSQALLTLARLGRLLGWTPIGLAPSARSPLHHAKDVIRTAKDPATLGDDVASAARDGRVLVLVDDANRLSGDTLGIEQTLGEHDGVLVVASGPLPQLTSRSGVMRSVPAPRAAVLLAPTSDKAATHAGIGTLDPELVSMPRPGRGVFIVAKSSTEIQFPAPPAGGR